jgi:hypothetical protein
MQMGTQVQPLPVVYSAPSYAFGAVQPQVPDSGLAHYTSLGKIDFLLVLLLSSLFLTDCPTLTSLFTNTTLLLLPFPFFSLIFLEQQLPHDKTRPNSTGGSHTNSGNLWNSEPMERPDTLPVKKKNTSFFAKEPNASHILRINSKSTWLPSFLLLHLILFSKLIECFNLLFDCYFSFYIFFCFSHSFFSLALFFFSSLFCFFTYFFSH